MHLVLLIAALLMSATQTRALTGTWNVMYDGDMRRVRDGEWQVVKRTRATLVLQQRGDAVFGIWKNDIMPEATELRGSFDGKVLKLTTGLREITGQIDGKPERMRVRHDWTASFDGDALRGTMFIHVGDRPPPARTWQAARVTR